MNLNSFFNLFKSGGTEEIIHVISIFLCALITLALGLLYKAGIDKSRSYEDLSSFHLFIFLFVKKVAEICRGLVGRSYSWFVPLSLYIICYFWISNVLSLVGLPPIGGNLIIPFSMAIVVFLFTIVLGISHRKWEYLDDYVTWIKIRKRKVFLFPDPIKMIGEVSRVLSLSCRLWGNTLAGSLLLHLIYNGFDSMAYKSEAFSGLGVFLVPMLIFPLHIYFDLIDGTLQPFVFFILTITFWSMSSGLSRKASQYIAAVQ